MYMSGAEDYELAINKELPRVEPYAKGAALGAPAFEVGASAASATTTPAEVVPTAEATTHSESTPSEGAALGAPTFEAGASPTAEAPTATAKTLLESSPEGAALGAPTNAVGAPATAQASTAGAKALLQSASEGAALGAPEPTTTPAPLSPEDREAAFGSSDEPDYGVEEEEPEAERPSDI